MWFASGQRVSRLDSHCCRLEQLIFAQKKKKDAGEFSTCRVCSKCEGQDGCRPKDKVVTAEYSSPKEESQLEEASQQRAHENVKALDKVIARAESSSEAKGAE